MENKTNTTVMEAAKEMAKEAVVETKSDKVEKTSVPQTKPCGFVQYSFSASDAFARREVIKDCDAAIKDVVAATGGNMPTELIDAYEGLHQIMEHIKRVELDVIRVGR